MSSLDSLQGDTVVRKGTEDDRPTRRMYHPSEAAWLLRSFADMR